MDLNLDGLDRRPNRLGYYIIVVQIYIPLRASPSLLQTSWPRMLKLVYFVLLLVDNFLGTLSIFFNLETRLNESLSTMILEDYI